jgi:AraC-like DNA-binding protein
VSPVDPESDRIFVRIPGEQSMSGLSVGAGRLGGVSEPYRERPARVPGAILWTSVGDGTPHLVLPDGCMDLLWFDEQLVVAGPDTSAFVSRSEPGARVAGVRFAPGTGPALLGVPALEVRDTRVPLADLWSPGRVRRLADRIGRSSDVAGALELEALQLEAGSGPTLGRGAAAAVAGVRRGLGVSAIAGGLGLSERQLHRRCLEVFGYGLKTLARILRMNDALELGRAGHPLAQVAAQVGYDQAHLTREVKALAGVPPRVLLS